MTCETCKFYLAPECRRFPPTLRGFAQVSATTFCGEWKEKAVEVKPIDESAPKPKSKWIK